MNLKNFAETKLDNFCIYLYNEFQENPKIKEEIERYRKFPILDFLLYIRENVAGQNLEKYVDDKFSIYFPDQKLNKEVHNKIVKYLQMFIDLSL